MKNWIFGQIWRNLAKIRKFRGFLRIWVKFKIFWTGLGRLGGFLASC
ncbi:hypothetical protein IKF81_02675 [Candidatus Saccharibacteria bacterium]|nr:hypothetical protein [Candidatus Saccharibacteria bacterium]